MGRLAVFRGEGLSNLTISNRIDSATIAIPAAR
jgi:hypothetical protein